MKYRLIAGLLLLAIALTACSSATTSTGNDLPSGFTPPEKPTEATAAPATTEALTEAPTETPTEAPTEAPVQYPTDVDLGSLDGSTYQNETIGISCTLPDGWYIYNQTDLAALNNFVSQQFDNAAITSAIESGQAAVIFCASQPEIYSSVTIAAEKNKVLGFSEEAIINYTIPPLKAQLEQMGLKNIDCDIVEVEFAGQKHKAIEVTSDASGTPFYETIFSLPCGDFIYSVSVSSTQKTTITDMLDLFEPIG